ncbi:helix-turn-helix domain-containing protein [Rhizobacter sp. Root1221]|uniref:helix-turn-helix domain-containing protein n=1 Tax=Rhizobacter sp. Root1221 TaxID=1736433 RepID=UPI0009E7BF6E|nr:helix-turn-helix domain-containing protein [Rhizobacter sp. Root1221]
MFRLQGVHQLSAHLKAFRKAKKLTQAELGRLIGVKQTRIADIEADPGSISVDQLIRILKALGVDILLDSGGEGWRAPDAADDPERFTRAIKPSATAAKSTSDSKKGTIVERKPAKRRGSW